jgi:predicted DNA-binding transcriptional regulator YafY
MMNYIESDNENGYTIVIADDDPNFQPKAILAILNILEHGKELTIAQTHSLFTAGVSERQVRRYIKILEDCGLVTTVPKKFDSKNRIYCATSYNTSSNKSFSTDQLLSLYVLKQLLVSFRNTFISKEIDAIILKIQQSFGSGLSYFLDVEEVEDENNPNEYTDIEQKLYWNQLPGVATISPTVADPLLHQLLDAILQRTWIDVTFFSTKDNEVKTRTVFPFIIYSYDGLSYAYMYHPEHKKSFTLSLHHIQKISISKIERRQIPFNQKEFLESRFAVFEGKLEKVSFTIKDEFRYLFEHRHWHISQTTSTSKGKLVIKMEVPLKPDFISWVIRWSKAFSDIKPAKLKEMVVQELQSTIQSLSADSGNDE